MLAGNPHGNSRSLLGKALGRDLYRRGEMVKDIKKATKVLSRKYSTDWLA